MASGNDWVAVVDELTRQTQSDEIAWTRCHNVARKDVIADIYETKVKGRRIICFEYQFRSYHEVDDWHWESDVAIEFVDEHGELQWRFPETQGRWNLLEAIRYRISGAQEFLNEFLNDR